MKNLANPSFCLDLAGGGYSYRLIISSYEHADHGLVDYKFFCFDGRVEFLYVMGDRTVGESVKVSLFDRDFKLLPVTRKGDLPFVAARKPSTYQDMLSIAEVLAKEFPHVRVDLYSIDGEVKFGEMTFFNASGYMMYDPDSFDSYIGELWKI